MLRRTCVSSFQRSTSLFAKKATEKKGPVLTSTRGATGPEGDTVIDKAIFAACLGGVGAWWCVVDGPHNMH